MRFAYWRPTVCRLRVLNCCVIDGEATTVRIPANLQMQLGKYGVDLEVTFYYDSASTDNAV